MLLSFTTLSGQQKTKRVLNFEGRKSNFSRCQKFFPSLKEGQKKVHQHWDFKYIMRTHLMRMFCQIFNPDSIWISQHKFYLLNERSRLDSIKQTKYQSTALERLRQDKYKYCEKIWIFSPSLCQTTRSKKTWQCTKSTPPKNLRKRVK